MLGKCPEVFSLVAPSILTPTHQNQTLQGCVGLGSLTVEVRNSTLSAIVVVASFIPTLTAPAFPMSVCTKLHITPSISTFPELFTSVIERRNVPRINNKRNYSRVLFMNLACRPVNHRLTQSISSQRKWPTFHASNTPYRTPQRHELRLGLLE